MKHVYLSNRTLVQSLKYFKLFFLLLFFVQRLCFVSMFTCELDLGPSLRSVLMRSTFPDSDPDEDISVSYKQHCHNPMFML